MPTWLIDGQDLVELLEVTWLAGNKVSAIGVEPSHPFKYSMPSVFTKVPVNSSARQLVLSIDFGDSVGSFATVLVSVDDDFVHWRDFESVEGARTALAACGPFSFARKEYARVMRGVVQTAFAALKQLQMYGHLDEKSFDGLW